MVPKIQGPLMVLSHLPSIAGLKKKILLLGPTQKKSFLNCSS